MNYSELKTNDEQSRKLLILGLNPKTADYPVVYKDLYCSWSFECLKKLLPVTVILNELRYNLNINENGVSYSRNEDARVSYVVRYKRETIIDSMIEVIRWLIKHRLFDQKHLIYSKKYFIE